MYENLPTYKLWLLAIRPKTLPAAGGPIVVGLGAAINSAGWNASLLLPFIACFLGSVLLQIGVNLANDYFDGKSGIDAGERKGPVRVTQSGLISYDTIRLAIFVVLAVSALLFLYLASVGGWPVVVVGVISLLSALAYSGGPWPIASHGMGEVFVFLFYGLIGVCTTYYVLVHELQWMVFWAAFPPGMLISAIMVVNNFRDIESDSEAGKITLAVRFGRYNTILLYKFLIYGSYLIPLLFVLNKWASAFVLLPIVTFFAGRRLCVQMEYTSGFDLNEVLASTAKLSLLFCLLFACGLALHF